MEISFSFRGKIYKKNASAGAEFSDFLKENFPEISSEAVVLKSEKGLLDLSSSVELVSGAEVLGVENSEAQEVLRHSTSHVMAHAVKNLFPGAKVTIGPAIENGFYYDFDVEKPFTPEDLAKIEEEMRRIIAEGRVFERQELPKKEAAKLFEKMGEFYKVELIAEIPDEVVSLYREGDFVDLCRGPHLLTTTSVKYFKLLNAAGAYWRGSEKNKMLQRIYGAAFFTENALKDYLNFLEEAEKRDHRKLGKELGIFQIHEVAGAGLIHYPPKGAIIRHLLEDFLWKEHLKRNYLPVEIPHIARAELWKISGHYDYYRENMYFLNVDEQEFVLKPMNCPGHILIYQSEMRSWRDLPLKYFEFGTVYRYEKTGVLHGLLRVRGFTQDDAHIFCRTDQLQQQIIEVLEFALEMMRVFGFKYEIFLSTRPEKFAGTEKNWEMATQALIEALKVHRETYQIDPGAGVFYGPKIDIKMKDALGRSWQGPTIQVDFNNPERFSLSYIGPDGARHQPVMIHRVVLGSLERFLGALIEHYGGDLPLWLAPVQVAILPITDKQLDFGTSLKKTFEENDLRVFLDDRNEKLNYKIRSAEVNKIPYVVVAGDKEISSGELSVRGRHGRDVGKFKMEQLVEFLKQEIKAKK
jgi:threonyl-tRNA synthetase